MRISFRTKLLLWIVPILAIGLLTLSWSSYLYIHKVITEEITRSTLASTGKSAETIEHWLETLLLEPETIAATPAARMINRDFTPIDQQNVFRYQLLHRKYASMFLDIYAADRRGAYHTVRCDAHGRYSFFKGTISDRPYFKSIMAGDGAQISPPLTSRTFGTPTLFVVAPILDGRNRPQGLVGAGISLDYVKRVAESLTVGRSGYGFILARDGTFISHPDPDMVMNKRITEFTEPSILGLGRAMMAGGSGSFRYTYRGVEKIAFYQPIPLPGWSVATTIPVRELFAPATRMLSYFVVVTVIITLLIAMMLALAARHMTAPLSALARHAAGIGTTELRLAEVDLKSGDEIGALAETFNGMARRLNLTLETLTLDIAARKQFEAELRASENKFSSIFRLSPDAIDLTQLETGVCIEVNPCYERMYGYSRDELLGHSTLPGDLGLWQRKEDRDRHIADLKAVGVAHSLEVPVRRKDGTGFIALISSSILEINGQRCNLSLAKDITERKRAEEELRRLNRDLLASEAENRAMINAIPDLIFTLSREGEYLTIQASDPRLLLLPSEQLLHRKAAEVLPGPIADQFLRTIETVLATESVQELNYTLSLTGGESAFEARMAPFAKDTVLAIVRDVTEKQQLERRQRELQAQLQQTQKMESLGSLAGGVAHDMNNVLAAILAMTSVLDGHCQDAEARKVALATITRACTRGRNVVKSLLYVARKGLETVGPVNLNSIVGEVVQLLSYTTLRRVRITTSLAEPLGLIQGDEGALSHAMLNLCVNAVDAMPDGGTLEIRTRRREGWGVEVSCQDTGTGMSAAVLGKAMEPFYTTKPVGKGTGLGLAMVYGTVRAHQGTIEIRSEVGQGTEVILGFPGSPEAPGAAAGPGAEAVPGTAFGPGTLKILLVDDDELIRTSVAPMLAALGHQVETAEGGQEALERFQQGLAVDLVILDMNMPGLNGAQTLARLLQLRPGQAVLLATGYSDASFGRLATEFPTVDSLRKPFSLTELRTKLETMASLRAKLGLPG